MEDRGSDGLWLDTTDAPAETYGANRAVPFVLHPGVLSASWWSNANSGRTDLPRRLPEFSTLGLFEVDASFSPPEWQDGTGYHFRRTPRPGQGLLTGQPTIGLVLVLISARSPDQRQQLRDWGDFVHIRHIVAASVPGYGMITPYRQAGDAAPHFLHLYEIDADDPEAVFQSMTPLVQARLGRPGTPVYDDWASHPALRIEYVNTFRRVGHI
ncbi:MAG TPA: hypothetical protein VLL25_03445 [Acidimicrobiales bacterium]|nr:hypothetical protein [Acidimicrobiales bacterium]